MLVYTIVQDTNRQQPRDGTDSVIYYKKNISIYFRKPVFVKVFKLLVLLEFYLSSVHQVENSISLVPDNLEI